MLSNALNREQVWLREQALEKEKQRTEELRRQIQEERERMELLKAQNGATDEDFAVTDSLHSFFTCRSNVKSDGCTKFPLWKRSSPTII